jgi:hypothetical protein
MKRRFLLLLTLGISFTPAVFASVRPADRSLASLPPEKAIMAQRVTLPHTGENKLSETGSGSWICEYAQMNKRLGNEKEQDKQSKVVRAVGAQGVRE